MLKVLCVCVCSVTSNSLQFHSLWNMHSPTRLLCLWNFLGKSTGAGFHFLLQGIFLTQALNPCLLYLLHWQVDSLSLCQVNLLLDFAQGSMSLPWQSEQPDCAYGMLALPFWLLILKQVSPYFWSFIPTMFPQVKLSHFKDIKKSYVFGPR